jgi:hypothetical protein
MEQARRDHGPDGAERVDLGREGVVVGDRRVHEQPAVAQAYDRHSAAGLDAQEAERAGDCPDLGGDGEQLRHAVGL